ncbi:TPA: methyltransferase [archaeon]|uniref:Methyltransferase n=1 Tax=Candidatus Undinarchaeum marinum TaxID=2756141 RepID=A0A832ULE9_9ARCH|nr:methyltransferase [Candidatus Undinarchaeum marinum]
MKTFYRDFVFEVSDDVYSPREDSFLIADSFELKGSEKVLDLGTGSGILAIIAASKGCEVTAADINPEAVKYAKKNAERNQVSIEVIESNLFENIPGDFDIILFNLPYLKITEEPEKAIDLSYNSPGTIEGFLREYKEHLKPGGRAIVVSSSLSGIKPESLGKIIARQKLPFEEIFVVELE